MEKTKYLTLTITGFIGSFVVNLLGGWSTDLTTLIALMGTDLIIGILIAMVFKKSPKTDTGAASSNTMFKGLCKKGVMLLVILVAHRVDISLGMSYIRTAVIIAFISNELISIVENIGIIGIPLPPILTNAIDILKKKSENE